MSTIPPVNPKRKKKLFKRNYTSKERVEWIVAQRCYVSGRPGSSSDPIVPSHVKSKGSGGTGDDVIPMLASLENELHQIGVDRFQDKHDVDFGFLRDICIMRWEAHCGKAQ